MMYMCEHTHTFLTFHTIGEKPPSIYIIFWIDIYDVSTYIKKGKDLQVSVID